MLPFGAEPLGSELATEPAPQPELTAFFWTTYRNPRLRSWAR